MDPDGEFESTSLQYELRIGVTGHRDIARPNEVEDAVRSLLQRVISTLEGASANPFGPHGSRRSRTERLDRRLTASLAFMTRGLGPPLDGLLAVITWPVSRFLPRLSFPRVPTPIARPDAAQQTPVKLTVISALASGADQIVARAACSLVSHPEYRNRYVEAVLPVPPEIYEQGFESPDDREAFRVFLKLDCGHLNTHPRPTVLFPSVEDEERAFSHEEAYAAAGRYVVNTSEIVIAVWDPAHPRHSGGTEDTVRYAIDRGRLVLWLNPADLHAGPFALRSTSSDPWPSDQTPAPHIQGLVTGKIRVECLPSRAKLLSPHFHRLAAYNRDGAADSDRPAALQERSSTLTDAARACGLPAPITSGLVHSLLPHVVRADVLAVCYRNLRDFSAKLWPTAAAFVVTLMAFQIIFLPSEYWMAWVELAVLLLGYVSYRVSRYDAWHEKWLHDRHLAEGLRGAMFVALVRSEEDDALERERIRAATQATGRNIDLLPFYSPANAWFVDTMKRLLAKQRRGFAKSLALTDPDQRKTVARFLREAWILEQADHHRRRVAVRRRLVRASESLRFTMIAALVVIAGLHALGIGHGHDTSASQFERWVGFATIALPAWAAAFHVMFSLDDHERMAERSALMAILLDGVADQLARADSIVDLQNCVRQAERILDLEAAEWAESLTDRRPEFTG